jgi:hypothetical protein
MPLQERVRAYQGGERLEPVRTDFPGFGRQSVALVVVEAGRSAQLFSEDSDLLLEVFDHALLVTANPPGHAQEQGLKLVQDLSMQWQQAL